MMLIHSLASLVVSALLLRCPSVNHHVNWLISFSISRKKSSLSLQGHFSHSVLAECFPALSLVTFLFSQAQKCDVVDLQFGTRLLVSGPMDFTAHYLQWVALAMSQGAPVFPRREHALLHISALPSSSSLHQICHPCNKSCSGHVNSESFCLVKV